MNTLNFTGNIHHIQTPNQEINIFSGDQMLVAAKLEIIQIEKIGNMSFDLKTVEEISNRKYVLFHNRNCKRSQNSIVIL